MGQALAALAAVALLFATGIDDVAARDRNVPRHFQKLHPCPATGKRTGPCPGWQIDHRIPLKCGGADKLANLQWLTVKDHKAKTRREARWCRKKN